MLKVNFTNMKENNTYLDEICLNMLRFLSIKKLFNIFNLLRLHCTISTDWSFILNLIKNID